MAAVHMEMHSFMLKFGHLSNLGLNASLNFNCVSDRVYVNLVADLGSYQNFCNLPNVNVFQQYPRRRRRCRERKKNADNTQNFDGESTDNDHSINDTDSTPQNNTEDMNYPSVSDETSVTTISVPSTSSDIPTFQADEETPGPQCPTEEQPVVHCSMCPDEILLFSKRQDFLRHMCVDHFNEEHLVDFPEFLPNDIYQQAMKLTK